MQDILEHAARVAPEALALAGHDDADWRTLRGAAAVTTPWASDLAASFIAELQRCGGTARFAGAAPSDRESSVALWLEKILSGAPGDGFWGECCLIGLRHAAAGVESRHVLALGTRLELELARRAFAALPADEAVALYAAFKRVFGVALGLVVDTAVDALVVGMREFGMNDRVLATMRRVAIRRMIDGARQRLPLIDWSDAIAVGVDAIDAQHRRLVELLNALHTLGADGDRARTQAILSELTEYTVHHFAFEERLMEDAGYPELAAHRAAHEALVARVRDLDERFRAGKVKLTHELFTFLRSWLNGHIRGTDRRYAPYLAAQAGDSPAAAP